MRQDFLPERCRLARTPTPLIPLRRLSEKLGGPRLWVKRDDLSGGLTSGNKIRKLEFILHEALQQKCDTLITCGALQSNHCRATAAVGARCGMRVHLVLRGEAPRAAADGNLLLARLLGAEIDFLPHREYPRLYMQKMQERAEECVRRGGRARLIPTGGSDATGIWGYIAAVLELREDFRAAGIRPRHIVCATGSGGTQAGLCAGAALFLPELTVWGVNVCEDATWFKKKIRKDLREWKVRYRQALEVEKIEIHILDAYAGPGYARAEAPVFDTIAALARSDALLLDPVYTGKAFHGLLAEYRSGRFGTQGDIVFLHTGGLYGLFPQRENFSVQTASAG